MERLFRKVLIGGGITLLSMIIIKAMALVNSVIAARLLEPSDYGALSVVVNLQNLIVIVGCFGMPLALAKHTAEWKHKDPATARLIASALILLLLISSAVTAVVYLVLADVIAVGLYDNPNLVTVIRLSAIFVLVAAVNQGLVSILQGCQKILTLAKINTLIAVAAQPLMYLFIVLFGLEGAIIAMFCSNLFSISVLVLTTRHVLPVSFAKARRVFADKSRLRSLMSFSVPAFIATLVVVPAYWIGRTVLALTWDFYSVGQFQIAESISQLVHIIPAAISVPLLPLVSEQYSKNPLEVGQSTNSLLRIVVFFSLPISIIMLPLVGYIIGVLYGSQYEDAYHSSLLMIASATFVTVGSVISSVIIGSGRMWDALGLNVVWLIAFLMMVLVLVSSNGSEGLAGAYLVSYAVYFFALILYFRKKFDARVSGICAFVVLYSVLVALYMISMANGITAQKLIFSVSSALTLGVVGYRFLLSKEERDVLSTTIKPHG
ncbi:MAG: oligosaccharide flippase family protein [Candidatus Sifarchaeia archaeon]